MNFREVRGPYGGGNQFLRALRRELERRGHEVTTRIEDAFEVALVNALMEGIDTEFVRRLAERVPVVHRKVGYRVSGTPNLRRVVDGVVWGDKLQLDFSPYLTHTIFQSAYSRDVFVGEGFEGPHTVIHNGVDESVFNPMIRRRLRAPRPRTWWGGREPLRVVISSWSTDENKGFPDYRRIDEEVAALDGVRLTLVGRIPDGTRFRNTRHVRARPARRVAEVLKREHVLLQLARHETCSNALIEGINCGLPAIYLDSGSNAEIASRYGVEYRGDFGAALDAVRERYDEFVEATHENPYRVSLVAARYEAVLEEAVRAA